MADQSKMNCHETFTVGRLLCKTVRQNLDKAKFMGRNLDYIESKGWLESEFTVRGDEAAIRAVRDYVTRLHETTK